MNGPRTGEADQPAPVRQFARLTVASEPYGTLFVDGAELTKRYPDLLALTAQLRG